MLLKVLKTAAQSLVSNRRGAASVSSPPGADADPGAEYPLETEQKLNQLHGRAPIDRHLDILYQDARVGADSFAELFRECLKRTGTAVTPFNTFQRFQTRLDLVHYLLATLAVPGARAECGAYRGATALLLAHAWRSREPAFKGADFYLVDSFSGSSASVANDLISVRDSNGTTRREAFFPVGRFDSSAEEVRGFFTDFPEVKICAGWIPQVFGSLPDRDWAFVHLDLALFEPTLASLEYFYPRLNKGGVMICDGSIFCPGAAKAWDQFCARRSIAYVTLGHRETVLIK
ncbi:MAG TPA: TylF/MycF/NovP-related O-methyltransferase [Burkholderiales bacterium]|nr:TylF/MycF/NovP-related O-methyltransferase [Burkholderiales bacterium]